jgi:hypothetical protein
VKAKVYPQQQMPMRKRESLRKFRKALECTSLRKSAQLPADNSPAGSKMLCMAIKVLTGRSYLLPARELT